MGHKLRLFWAFFKLTPYFIYCYFGWLLRYSNHPEKYPFEKRYAHIKKLAQRLVNSLHIEFDVTGIENFKKIRRPFIGISNHRNFMDPLFYIYLSDTPVSFVGKIEAKKMPFVGRTMRCFDSFFIDRDDLMSQMRTFKEVVKRQSKGDISYFIFPEGTRMKDRHSKKTLPYKDGSLKLAYWSNSDVLYASMYGTDSILYKKPKGVKKRKVLIEFFEPLKYEDIKDKPTTDVMPLIEKETNESLAKMADKYKVFDE